MRDKTDLRDHLPVCAHMMRCILPDTQRTDRRDPAHTCLALLCTLPHPQQTGRVEAVSMCSGCPVCAVRREDRERNEIETSSVNETEWTETDAALYTFYN